MENFENFELIEGLDGNTRSVANSVYANFANIEAPPTEVEKKVAAHSGDALDICFNSLGDSIVTTGADLKVKFWQVKRLQHINTLPLRGKPASILALSNDGDFLFTG